MSSANVNVNTLLESVQMPDSVGAWDCALNVKDIQRQNSTCNSHPVFRHANSPVTACTDTSDMVTNNTIPPVQCTEAAGQYQPTTLQ